MHAENKPKLTGGLLAVLGFMTAVGPFATDLYLPSLPQIGEQLQTDAASVQLTLTAFLFGMSIGQLTFGPLSDRFGRRNIVIGALLVFAVSSTVLVASGDIWMLIALRLLQGISGAAGVVIARAIAADLSEGATAVRALSLMATVSSLGILGAPLIGGVLTTFTDWRGSLGVVAFVAWAMFLLALWRVPESLPRAARRTGGIGSLLRTFWLLLSNRVFAGNLCAHVFAFATMLAYISASSFVVQSVLGLGPLAYALTFAFGAAAMLVVNSINAHLAPRVGPRRMQIVGLMMLSLAAASLTVQTTTGTLTVLGFMLSAVFVTGGAGLVMANSTALALAEAATARGTGSALLGSTQFLFGAVATPIVGLWGEHTALPMALTIAAGVVLAIAGATLARRSRA